MIRIGVFDSGIGGLSVLRHALNHLPQASFIYCADSAHAPYGERPPEWVRARSLRIARHLRDRGVDALVIACNTATALAAEAIREALDIPVIAMEPAIKPAAAMTRSGRVAVLATASTLASRRYRTLRQRHAADIEVIEYAPHHWVTRIEQGEEQAPDFVEGLRRELQPMIERGVDTWVLACTHFPFLSDVIAEAVGGHEGLIDPAPAVTAELRRRVPEVDRPATGGPRLRLLSSADPAALARRVSDLLSIEDGIETGDLPC